MHGVSPPDKHVRIIENFVRQHTAVVAVVLINCCSIKIFGSKKFLQSFLYAVRMLFNNVLIFSVSLSVFGKNRNLHTLILPSDFYDFIFMGGFIGRFHNFHNVHNLFGFYHTFFTVYDDVVEFTVKRLTIAINFVKFTLFH